MELFLAAAVAAAVAAAAAAAERKFRLGMQNATWDLDPSHDSECCGTCY